MRCAVRVMSRSFFLATVDRSAVVQHAFLTARAAPVRPGDGVEPGILDEWSVQHDVDECDRCAMLTRNTPTPTVELATAAVAAVPHHCDRGLGTRDG